MAEVEEPRSVAEWAAVLFAADPVATGGVYLRGPSGPETQAWLELTRTLAGPVRWTAVSPSVELDHLVGAVDLEVTLATGRMARRAGLLEGPDGSVLEIRWPAFLSLESAHALVRASTRLGVVAFQPTAGEDDAEVWNGLTEALACWVLVPGRWAPESDVDDLRGAVARARRTDPTPEMPEALLRDVVAVTSRLGLHDVRSTAAVLRVARLAAAARGATEVASRDAGLAMALVALPRTGAPPETEATPAPAAERPDEGPNPPEAPPPAEAPAPDVHDQEVSGAPSAPVEGADIVVASAAAWLPPDVLAALVSTKRASGGGRGTARARTHRPTGGGTGRGRTLRARRGRPGRGRRLHFLETLRAAAPHQGDRKEDEPIRVRSEHLRIRVIERRDPGTIIFVVDASGSQAVARLGEVKGAVELLLADSYRRRDHVALIAFRGEGAELLLPPTRSLTRVRRTVGELPGGGGTPLAHGLALALRTAEGEERFGRRPSIVVLTDGRANVAMGEGRSGKEHAREDALAAARALGERGWPTLFVDSARRPGPTGEELARTLGARVIRLTTRDPASLSDAVREITVDVPAGRGGMR